MKLGKLLASIDVTAWHADSETEIAEVRYDSRKVEMGDLYIAVRGYQTDGHRYIADAVKNGAVAVVCEQVPDVDVPYVLVRDSREALALIGVNRYDHPAEQMTMIAVTGTNGKTTVTYLLKSVLEQTLGAKVGLIGTIRNMIGDEEIPTERTTPESYDLQALFRRMADAGCTHVVMETSSHALYLHRVAGVRFHVGIFTNLTEDHLDFHKTMENYRKAKEILFEHCEIGIFNYDDPAASAMLEASKATTNLTYAVGNDKADLCARDLQLFSDRVEFNAVIGNEISRFCLGIPGRFSAYNALAAIACASSLGVPLGEIAAALRQTAGVKGRVEVVPTPGKDYTVLIDYAHTPDGLENVLKSVKGYCKGRLIAVFGCGGDRDPFKRPIMGKIGVDLADEVIFTSDNPRTEDPNEILRQIVIGAEGTKTPYTVIENRRAAIRHAMDIAQKDDIIVLAGKGHETYQEIGKEKFHLDEREEVQAYLQEK